MVGQAISEQFGIAFAEDSVVLEAVQADEERRPDRRLGLDFDVSDGLFRRMTHRLLAGEQAVAAQ